MSWLFPGFLIGLAAAALPLILHLLRKRVVRPVAFPALRFLGESRVADSRRHRLRRWLVLLMRCLAFGLLAAAFARPFFKADDAGKTRATIVVVDNSFSLQISGRWRELHTWARGELGKPWKGETLGLLLMNPRPTWLLAPTSDVSAARKTFETLAPGWEATSASPALRFAADVLAASPAGTRRIIFLGDHQANGWENTDFKQTLPPGVSAVFPPVPGAPARQAALLTPVVSRDGDKLTVRVPVRSFTGGQRRILSVVAGDEDVPLGTYDVVFDGAGRATIAAVLPSAVTAEWIRCVLDSDDLPADDEAYALVPGAAGGGGERKLLLDRAPTDDGADHLGTAYAALATMPPTTRVEIAPATPWPAGAVAVLRNDASFAGAAAARLEAFLGAGGSALVFVTGGPAQAKWLAAHRAAATPVAETARLRDWSVEHALVAPLAERGLRSLVGWQFERGWALPAQAVEPLAFWNDGSPALGELPVGAGRVLLAGFSADRRDGNWPVESAFVPFLHRAAGYLFGAPARVTPETTPLVGAALTLPGERGAWQAVAGPAAKVPARDVGDRVTPTAPGVYAWTAPGVARRLFAVGLAPEESDPAAWSDGTPWLALVSKGKAPAQTVRENRALAAVDAEEKSHLWWWCFALAAVLLLAELGLANRTAR